MQTHALTGRLLFTGGEDSSSNLLHKITTYISYWDVFMDLWSSDKEVTCRWLWNALAIRDTFKIKMKVLFLSNINIMEKNLVRLLPIFTISLPEVSLVSGEKKQFANK